MSIYRGAGGAGDAIADSASEALLVQQLAIEAQADADAAAASATAASGSASAAVSSASSAATSASNAATSATNSANSATASATSATNSANSATAAQTAETNAELAETNAETAQTAAELAETNAETAAATATTQAGIATTQASNASTSASAALASQLAAEAAFDAFDDIYLGAKASNPTVDNDGNALTTGDQYFNTVSNELRVWNGSSWQAASVIGGTVNSLDVTGSATFTSISDSGNLTFTGTGNRITGDFSNATASNRVAFQNSAANTQTSVSAIPNGTSVSASFSIFNNSNPTNAASFSFLSPAAGGEMSIRSGITGTGTYLPLTMFTGGSERLRIDTSGNAFVGGTSAPVLGYEKFGVYGTGGFKTASAYALGLWNTAGSGLVNFYTEAGGTNAGTITASGAQLSIAGGSSLNLTANGANVMTFTTNSTERMRIDSSGNVGIGRAANANNKLEVTGTINSRTAGNTGVTTVWAQAHDFWDLPTYGGVGVQYWGTSASGTTMGITNAGLGHLVFQNVNNALIGCNGGTPIIFATTATERMRIDSSGNVGIGTSNPSGKLEVLGGVANTIANAGTADAATLTITNNDVSGIGRIAKTLYEIGNLPIASISGVYTDFNAGSDIGGALAFSTQRNLAGGVLERMRIDSSGNVGIGTSSPAYKLDVNGLTRFRFVSGTGAGTLLDTIGNAGRYFSGTDAVTESWRIYDTVAGAQRIFLDSAGNVGIGTSSAGHRLDVISNAAQGGLRVRNTSANLPTIILGSTDTANVDWQFQNDYGALKFLGGTGAERMRITSTGDVGIGTSSPNASLHLGAQGASVRVGITASDQYGQLSRDIPTGNIILNAAQSGTNLTFQTASTERMRITSTGQLRTTVTGTTMMDEYGCRAWVNFNGTGTVAIRGSGNVSSITDNGTGDYTVNFTTAMPDENASVNVTCQRTDTTGFEATYSGIRTNTSSNITTSSARVYTAFSTTAAFDAGVICVAVFR